MAMQIGVRLEDGRMCLEIFKDPILPEEPLEYRRTLQRIGLVENFVGGATFFELVLQF